MRSLVRPLRFTDKSVAMGGASKNEDTFRYLKYHTIFGKGKCLFKMLGSIVMTDVWLM